LFAAAKLDIRLTAFTRSRQIKTVALRNIIGFGESQFRAVCCRLDSLVLTAQTEFFLLSFHALGKSDFCKIHSHFDYCKIE